jgi:hypothetical protein
VAFAPPVPTVIAINPVPKLKLFVRRPPPPPPPAPLSGPKLPPPPPPATTRYSNGIVNSETTKFSNLVAVFPVVAAVAVIKDAVLAIVEVVPVIFAPTMLSPVGNVLAVNV